MDSQPKPTRKRRKILLCLPQHQQQQQQAQADETARPRSESSQGPRPPSQAQHPPPSIESHYKSAKAPAALTRPAPALACARPKPPSPRPAPSLAGSAVAFASPTHTGLTAQQKPAVFLEDALRNYPVAAPLIERMRTRHAAVNGFLGNRMLAQAAIEDVEELLKDKSTVTTESESGVRSRGDELVSVQRGVRFLSLSSSITDLWKGRPMETNGGRAKELIRKLNITSEQAKATELPSQKQNVSMAPSQLREPTPPPLERLELNIPVRVPQPGFAHLDDDGPPSKKRRLDTVSPALQVRGDDRQPNGLAKWTSKTFFGYIPRPPTPSTCRYHG
ncbi:hypothetical protein M3J09_012278 [Ascochyta lentis]